MCISHCRLTSLPHNLGHLQALKELHLRNNSIKYFPSSVERLNLYTFTGTPTHSTPPTPPTPHHITHSHTTPTLCSSYTVYLICMPLTAQNNSLYSESEATTFSKKIVCCVPPLLELCLRAAVQWGPFLEQGTLPQHLYSETLCLMLGPQVLEGLCNFILVQILKV